MTRILSVTRTLFSHRDFVVLILCCLLTGMAYSFVMPFNSLFGTKEVGMGPWMFGCFMTVTSLAGIAISTPLSRWSDTRYSRKHMLVCAGICGTLGYLGYAFVRQVWELFLIGSILFGIASIAFSQIFAQARDLLDRSEIDAKEIPLYMNVFRLFFALAWTVGPALASLVMARYSFRGTYLTAAGLFLAFTVLAALYIPAIPPAPSGKAQAAQLPLRKAFLLPGLSAAFAGLVCFFTCSTMGMMNLPLLIVDTLGGSERQVGIAYSLAPVFELPFMFYIGVWATRAKPIRLILFSLLLAIFYYGCLALVQAPWQIYPLQILSAAIVAVTSGIAITFFQDLLPGQAGTATNLYSNAMRLGAIGGYLGFGSLSSAFGNRAVFAVAAGLSCLAAYLMYMAGAARHPEVTTELP
ncbi:MAG: sugar efflux transporter [Fibrobacteria bacterium]